jgi:sister-chromatid-cohesion protein PDS5
LAAHIAALVQYARYAPDLFEELSDVVVEHLVRRAINVPILVCYPCSSFLLFHSCLYQDETPEGSEETAEEWYEDSEEIPSLLWAKIDTLKLFRHRCLNAAVAAMVAARNNESAGDANGKGKGKAKEADPEKEKEKAEKIVSPVIKMLQALLVHEGAMSGGVQEEYVPVVFPFI